MYYLPAKVDGFPKNGENKKAAPVQMRLLTFFGCSAHAQFLYFARAFV
jgi:hypothetical protein